LKLYLNLINLGGIETVTKERRWAKIANKLGYPSGRSVGSILKSHYERILYPFDVFKQGKTLADIVKINTIYLIY
jgi:histone demethylase JARID1